MLLAYHKQISIDAGWNIISGYVIPDEANFDSLLLDIVSDIVILKDGEGTVVVPGFINLIGDWDITQGYQVKAYVPTTMSLECVQVDPRHNTT